MPITGINQRILLDDGTPLEGARLELVTTPQEIAPEHLEAAQQFRQLYRTTIHITMQPEDPLEIYVAAFASLCSGIDDSGNDVPMLTLKARTPEERDASLHAIAIITKTIMCNYMEKYYPDVIYEVIHEERMGPLKPRLTLTFGEKPNEALIEEIGNATDAHYGVFMERVIQAVRSQGPTGPVVQGSIGRKRKAIQAAQMDQ